MKHLLRHLRREDFSFELFGADCVAFTKAVTIEVQRVERAFVDGDSNWLRTFDAGRHPLPYDAWKILLFVEHKAIIAAIDTACRFFDGEGSPIIAKVVNANDTSELGRFPLVLFYFAADEGYIQHLSLSLEAELSRRFASTRIAERPTYAKSAGRNSIVYYCQGEAKHRHRVRPNEQKYFEGEHFYRYRCTW